MPNPQPLSSNLAEGINLFNRGDYYGCHDVLEAIWMESATLDKPFYQGILQIAVGLYHLGNHNWRGACILLGEGVNRLRPFEPNYRGLAVDSLVDCGWAWLTALQQAGPSHVDQVAAAIPQAQIDTSDIATIDPEANDSEAKIPLILNGERLTLPLPYIHSAGCHSAGCQED